MDSQQFSQKSSTTDDLDLIDIESLFDEDTGVELFGGIPIEVSLGNRVP